MYADRLANSCIALGGLTGLIICLYYPSTLGGAPNKDRPLKQKLLGLGLKSAVILTATLVCLFLALQWGGTVYPWRDSRVWGCFLGFGFLLILFGYIQVRQKEEYVASPHYPTHGLHPQRPYSSSYSLTTICATRLPRFLPTPRRNDDPSLSPALLLSGCKG